MTIAYIGLGSNLGQPKTQLREALVAIGTLPKSKLVSHSSFYGSTPMGPQDQPDYVNAVAAIETELTPQALLTKLQHVEQTHGRVRKQERWGPRTLDLDILLYGDQIIETPDLVIPHYGMKEREFVLYPLHEIAPDTVLPDGDKLINLLAKCPLNGLEILPD